MNGELPPLRAVDGQPTLSDSGLPANYSDQELLAACRRRDPVAWETLVARYERLIVSVASRNGLSREDSADVAQSTFVALLDSIHRIRDAERLPFWLMTVARRQAWRLRDRRIREGSWLEPDEQSVDVIEDWEQLAAVHEALQQLGTPCRDLLLALYFDPAQPSYVQISQRLGHAIGTVGPMRARCLRKLQSLLGDDPRG